MAQYKPGQTGNPRGRPRKSKVDGQASVKADGWQNVLTNIGGRKDPTTAARVSAMPFFSRETLSALYRADGLARRIVDVQVEDALREWVECDDALTAEFRRINAKQEVSDALKWARLFGGALIVAMVDDGQDFDQPLNRNAIRSLRQLRVYDRHRVTFNTSDIDMDAMSETFGKPLFYTVTPISGTPYRVHASRAWRLDGLPLPDLERQLNQGWGDSALMPVYEALQAYGQTMGASANIVRDFVQVVLGIRGLTDMLRQGEDDLVAKRANIIDMTRSVANSVFLDADGETYDKKASSVAGLADLWDRFALHVSSVTGIPATKLLGRSPSGLNATGESDMRQWYDVVQAYRGDEIDPPVRWILGLIEAQSEWTDRPEGEIEITWPSLYQPTEAEWADVKVKIAQADAIYMDRGGVDPEYLYHLRYGSGEFRPDAPYTIEGLEEWRAGND
jgi:phage-related protein (TIGR01555 family)